MPAIKQVTKERILEAGVEIARSRGMEAVNARSLAARLKCSTRPIYLSFKGMEQLKAALKEEITKVYRQYLDREVEKSVYPPYKAYGMGYIRFAREEKNLFGYLFMRDRSSEEQDTDGGDLEEVYAALMKSAGLSRAEAERFHLESWLYVHGIAATLATSYSDMDDDTVSGLVSDMFFGLKARFLSLRAERDKDNGGD